MAGKIFINYRRDDSIGMAGRLHDRLAQTFGRDRLFMDVDHIPVGVDFVAHLNSQVAECNALLVVIGPNWLNAKDESGERRLDNPDDFVAIEIAAALARDIRVIPVLVDGARMPKAKELPDSLKPLARRQAVDVRHSHFGHDAEALIKRMREALGEGVPVAREREVLGDKVAGPSRWRVRAAIGVAAVAVLLLIGWGGYAVVQHTYTTVEKTAQQREAVKAEQERQARAAAQADEILWNTIKDSNVAALFEEFLRRFPSSPRTPDARARLDTLRRTQVAVTTPPAAQLSIPSQQPTTSLPIGGIIRIGVAGPMTGPSLAAGAQMRRGVEQAVEDINAAGGILRFQTGLDVGDDASDPRTGVSLANQFAQKGVQFVVGHYNSGVTIPASDVYQQNGIVAITPASTNPILTERGLRNIFRICGRDNQQGILAGNYITSHFPNGRVAIVHDKTVYGKGLAEVTSRTINLNGMKEVLFEGINTGEKNFSALVSRFKTSGATLVYYGGLYPEAGLLVREMRQQGVNATFMAADGITTDEFASIGGPGVEGTLMTFGPDPRNYSEAKAVVEKFRAKRFEPEGYTLYSYAAVQVIKQAAEAAKSVDPKKVAEQMHSGMRFKTVIGDISFDEKGDITRIDYVMYVWRKGRDGKISFFEKR